MRPIVSEADLQVMVQRMKQGRGSTDARRTTATSGSSRKAAIQQTNSRRGESAPSPYKIEMVLLGKIPSGKNAVKTTRYGRHYASQRFKDWRTDALAQLAMQWDTRTITTPVRLHCLYWPGDRITRDVSGMADALFHLLVKAGILKDDGLIHDLLWYRQGLNRKFPKLCLTILTL